MVLVPLEREPEERPASRRRRSGGEPPMEVALRMIARRACSRAEIDQALERRGIARAEIRRVLGRLVELGYVDDRKLAGEWSERLQTRGFGSLRIGLELARRGVEEELVRGVLPSTGEERDVAQRVLVARFGESSPAGARRKAQAARFLSSRGFPGEVIESVLDLWEE